MKENVNESGVRFEVTGALGIVTLDRPRALNALTHEMVIAIAAQLDDWESDERVDRVLFEGAGDRGFCAGGDVVAVREDVLSGGTASAAFWRDEYTLNARIARYSKPTIAFMDGLVLGGGVGLASHARYRVVTEDSKVGMPETMIGFVPDVGGTWLLSHAPGELGTLLALTAEPVEAADAIFLGLADDFVARRRLPELRTALARDGALESISSLSASPGKSALEHDQEWIDACFAHDEVTEIVASLRSAGHDDVADTIESRSPSALVLALESLRRSRVARDLESALVQEFRVSTRCLGLPDFAEGIRAQLVDKDRSPHWNPASLAEVDRTALLGFFEPVGEGGDLDLPAAPAAA